jgi:hypothetical protein
MTDSDVSGSSGRNSRRSHSSAASRLSESDKQDIADLVVSRLLKSQENSESSQNSTPPSAVLQTASAINSNRESGAGANASFVFSPVPTPIPKEQARASASRRPPSPPDDGGVASSSADHPLPPVVLQVQGPAAAPAAGAPGKSRKEKRNKPAAADNSLARAIANRPAYTRGHAAASAVPAQIPQEQVPNVDPVHVDPVQAREPRVAQPRPRQNRRQSLDATLGERQLEMQHVGLTIQQQELSKKLDNNFTLNQLWSVLCEKNQLAMKNGMRDPNPTQWLSDILITNVARALNSGAEYASLRLAQPNPHATELPSWTTDFYITGELCRIIRPKTEEACIKSLEEGIKGAMSVYSFPHSLNASNFREAALFLQEYTKCFNGLLGLLTHVPCLRDQAADEPFCMMPELDDPPRHFPTVNGDRLNVKPRHHEESAKIPGLVQVFLSNIPHTLGYEIVNRIQKRLFTSKHRNADPNALNMNECTFREFTQHFVNSLDEIVAGCQLYEHIDAGLTKVNKHAYQSRNPRKSLNFMGGDGSDATLRELLLEEIPNELNALQPNNGPTLTSIGFQVCLKWLMRKPCPKDCPFKHDAAGLASSMDVLRHMDPHLPKITEEPRRGVKLVQRPPTVPQRSVNSLAPIPYDQGDEDEVTSQSGRPLTLQDGLASITA